MGHIALDVGDRHADDPVAARFQPCLPRRAVVSRNPGVADTAALAAGSLFGSAKVKKPKQAGAAEQLVAV